ncbi:MAG: hypothetical protein P1U86_16455 [Verrucomicrobiales bacterium]|nr:hypothetical protein [Verrucomicrobiales bacterium]
MDLGKQIGFGIHGRVFTVIGRTGNWLTAAKVFEDEAPFERELAVYHRLEESKIIRIGSFAVPLLIDFDTEEKIIEMTLVDRPFCLDFASAYLDELPAYFPPFDQAWHSDKENQFGSEHWPEVLAAIRELESLGIYQTDVSPSNIALPKGQH